jgi:dephospho-CoA kinase
MKYTLIGLSGYAGSGKDALAQMMVERLGFERHAFADPMREMLYAMNPIVVADTKANFYRLKEIVDAIGWDAAKRQYSEVRSLLQRLGTEGGRNVLGQNIWVETLAKRYKHQNLVVPDVRFANEATFIKSHGGIIIRIKRKGVEALNAHASENSYKGSDFTIDNNGTLEELFKNLKSVLDFA